MESTSVKVLFFDVGGVLLTNGWGHESREKAAEHFGFNYGEMDILHDYIFNVYETGGINLDEYLDAVVFNHPREFTREDFKAFMYAQSVELPGLLAWLKEWKRDNCGFRIISLNNEGRELNEYRIKKFKLHQVFDAFVSSCEVGMRKPDPGIFKLAMGIAQAAPENCYHFDDRTFLVQSARKVGINGFHHTNFEETKAFLEQLKKENS